MSSEQWASRNVLCVNYLLPRVSRISQYLAISSNSGEQIKKLCTYLYIYEFDLMSIQIPVQTDRIRKSEIRYVFLCTEREREREKRKKILSWDNLPTRNFVVPKIRRLSQQLIFAISCLKVRGRKVSVCQSIELTLIEIVFSFTSERLSLAYHV